MVSSDLVLQKAGMRNLNEIVASTAALMVWKSKKKTYPLGTALFPVKSSLRPVRSLHMNKATQPVPGNKTLSTNLLARAWNNATELHDVTKLGAAKSISRKWASNLLSS